MGNDHSQNMACLLINFEEPYYYPGSKVRGNVNLIAKDDLDCKFLNINIQIVEYISFPDFEEQTLQVNQPGLNIGQTITKTKKVFNKIKVEHKKIHYTYSYGIQITDNFIKKGQYIYPITFVLPKQFPGSFEYYDHENTAYIRYIAKVSLEKENNEVTNNISHSNFLIVRTQNHKLENLHSQRFCNLTKLKLFGVVRKGDSSLEVELKKNEYNYDEKIEINCIFDNSNCNIKANCIRAELFQTIIFKHKNTSKRTFKRRVVEHRLDQTFVK